MKTKYNKALARPAPPCYDSVPHESPSEQCDEGRMQVRYFSEKRREKVELDEIFETLHNLASSLTNKTLCQHAVQNDL
jgi:hypothetical protein